MPLSEYEQRVLEQLERDLGTDPQLGRAMKRGPKARSRIALGVVGVVVGLGVVVIGVVTTYLWLGIVGFALMVAAALWALLGGSSSASAKPSSVKGKSHGGARQQPKSKQSFTQRMEERYDRRRENGDF